MTETNDAETGQTRRPVNPKSAREQLQPQQVPPPPTRSRAARHPLVVFLNFFVMIAVVAVLAIGGAGLFAKIQFDAAGPSTEQRSIQIAEGDSVADIAKSLQDLGFVSNRWIFRAGVTFYGTQSKLQAGEYLIPAGASMRQIMDVMAEGRAIVYSITIPEGLTSQQIVDRLNANDVLVGDIAEVPAEGTLLPETYQFSRGYTRQELIDQMRRERDRVVADVWSRRAPDLPISTPDQLVVLASIVEKETGIADERSRVAAVFINRLSRGMRLQSDPTVIYGIYGGAGLPSGHSLLQSELDRQTPYNTYQITGLPPGPVANPGVAALEAAANPSRTNDLYFVADGTGGHAFAETLDEHNRNVARYRQLQQQQQDAAAAAAAAAPPATDAAPAPPATPPAP